MKRLVLFSAAALLFGNLGCSSSSNNSGTGGAVSVTGGNTSNPPGPTGGTTSSSTTAAQTTGGQASNSTGGTTSAGTTAAQTTGGASAGGDTSAGGCGTADGTKTLSSDFATTLDPWKVNKWSPKEGTPVSGSLELTTTAPDGIDCSAGCAHLTAVFADGMNAYGGVAMDQYFGATETDVENLLNETVTVKLAVVVTGDPRGAVAIDLDGLDTFATTNFYDNVWVHNLGAFSDLATMTTLTHKVIDMGVPSWGVLRTVCASGLHILRLVVSNSAAITTENAATVDVYVQSVSVAP